MESSKVDLSDMMEIRNALINLYLNVKVRKEEEISQYNEESLREEVARLQSVDLLILIGYIKTSVEILVNLRSDEPKEELFLVSDKSTTGMQKGYNEMLQKLESEVRMHIRVILWT